MVVAGLFTQLGLRSHERELKEFKEHLTTLFLSILFVLLAADLRIDAMRAEGWTGVATVLLLMFAARPMGVWIATRAEAGISPRERIFLSPVGPRGIIAASLASLAAMRLRAAGIEGAERLEALVFLTIFLTVFLQGLSAPVLAHFLGVITREEGRILVVGANAVARALAGISRNGGRQVLLIDTNPDHAEKAEKEGLRTLVGSAMDPEILDEAMMTDTGAFVACTESSKVKEMTAMPARTEFDLPNVHIAGGKRSTDPRVRAPPPADQAGLPRDDPDGIAVRGSGAGAGPAGGRAGHNGKRPSGGARVVKVPGRRSSDRLHATRAPFAGGPGRPAAGRHPGTLPCSRAGALRS